MKIFLCVNCLLFCILTYAQEDYLIEKFELPEAVKETSGLLFFNNRIITHNDSGGIAKLYEIDTISQSITRTISITNATNVDWEDIAEDDNYLYVGDIGNNNGDRENLKVYRILKSDYINSTNVTADIISFSYEDQVDFTSSPNATNFDAEALTIYQDQIVIFTKNWLDYKTNAYIFPKTIGTYTAQKVSAFDTQGLITGAHSNGEDFLLTGYDTTATPFLIFLNDNRPPGNDFFGGNPTRISLEGDIFLEQGSQIEGVCSLTFDRWYISREYASTTVGSTLIEFPQKVYEFSYFVFYLLSTNDTELSKNIDIVPNPVDDSLSILQKTNPETIENLKLFSSTGKEIQIENSDGEISISGISAGIYFLQIELSNGKKVTKKLLKN